MGTLLFLSLVAVYGYRIHRRWISSSNSNFPGCFCVRTVNVSGGRCVLIPLPPPFPSPSLKVCPPSTYPPPTAWRDNTPVSSAPLTVFPTFIPPAAPSSSQDCSRSVRCAPWSGPILHDLFTSSSLHRIQLYIYHIHVLPATPPATRSSATAHDIAPRSFGIYSSLIGVLCVLGRQRHRHRIRIHNHIIHRYSSSYLIRPPFGWAERDTRIYPSSSYTYQPAT